MNLLIPFIGWKRWFLALALLITACQRSTEPVQPNTTPTTAEIPGTTSTPAETTQTVPEPSEPITLRVWLPPQFDPNAGTPAGDLLQNRLEEFALQYPDVQIDVRIKAASGPGGLLNALGATQTAAPNIIPDLIALPRADLEAAAIKGMLQPFNNQAFNFQEADLYEFGQNLARVKNEVYGLPFAGNALIMIYNKSAVEEPPRDWTSSLNLSSPLLFPAASPGSTLTLSMYQAAGGNIQDENGRPTIHVPTLTAVLRFYQDAQEKGVIPPWIATLKTDQEVWKAFQANRGDTGIVWINTYLSAPNPNTGVALIPTPGGVVYALMDGWSWALSNPQSPHQDLSAQLGYFLTESEFLALWTETAGYLPTRPSSLALWGESPHLPLVSRIVLAGQIIPSVDILNSISPAFQEATKKVIEDQADPEETAEDLASRLTIP